MGISKQEHMINKVINLAEEKYNEIELSAYLIRRDKKKEDYYFSKMVELDEELILFLKKNIVSSLAELKDINGSFNVKDYKQEFQLTDYIARFNITDNIGEQKVIDKVNLLLHALRLDKLENVKKSVFQVIKLVYKGHECSFCFYRSVKKNAKNKKWALWSSEEFVAVKDSLIEFGGNFSFFFDDNYIYIMDPRHFEWAFDYNDHITEQSKGNLNKITSMDFFPDDVTKRTFKNSANHHLLIRGIASIEEETLQEVQTHFENRVAELKSIKERRDNFKNQSQKDEFIEVIGELNNLINFIDFERNTVIFKEGDDPKPLLHFFQDKIMESFLTKKVKIAMSIN